MMLNQEIERGTVYYVTYSSDLNTLAVGRPFVVLTDFSLLPTARYITGVYTTTNEERSKLSSVIELKTMRRRSWAVVDQIVTVDRKHIGDRMCKLSQDDMDALEDAIRNQLGFAEQIVVKTDEKAESNLEFEVEYYRRMYEMAMNRLVERDFENRLTGQKAVEPEVIEPEITEPKVVEPVDLNQATTVTLWNLGLSHAQAEVIENNRPYKSMKDIQALPGITTICFKMLEQKCTVIPVKKLVYFSDKININTATAEDLQQLGIGEYTSLKFIAWRGGQKKLKSMDDVAKFPRMGKINIKKLEGKIEF